jgi:hypothetical protein
MVTGNMFGGGNRRLFFISIPLFQLVLYCVLTVIGDFQVRSLDEIVENAAKNNVMLDINIRTPVCHEVSFGLNFPVLIVGTLVGIVVPSTSDFDHSAGFQIFLGSLVPLFWFAVVRWAFAMAERLDNAAGAKSVRRFGLVFTVIAVAVSLWIWRHNRFDRWVFQVSVVCWISFGAFALSANRIAGRAVSDGGVTVNRL